MQIQEDLDRALVQAADGNITWVMELISKGADVNGMPLIMAIQCGELEIVKTLVEAGSDIEIDFAETTPLIRASSAGKPGRGYPDIVNFLIKASADVNKETLNGITSLKTATQRGNEIIIKLLIDAGAYK